jgi:hypothetical protein
MTPVNEVGGIRLGVEGWRHPGWLGSFYPGDMPEDWWLAFYNTQHACVYLGREAWKSRGPGEIEFWLSETHDHFLFLAEPSGIGEAPIAHERFLLMPRDHPSIVWFDRTTDLKSLSSWLRAYDPTRPGYALSRDADLGQIERVRTLLELMGL